MTTEKCEHGLGLNETCPQCEEQQFKIFKGVICLLIITGIVALAFEYYFNKAHARPNERWAEIQRKADLGDEDAIRRLQFFQAAGWLPANPERGYLEAYKANCCGQADAYETDIAEVDHDDCGFNSEDPDECGVIAVLTCNEPQNCEAIPGKRPIPAGTKIKIPHDKIMLPRRPVNNTGHGWVFLGGYNSDNGKALVYCYSQPSGM